MPLKALRGRHHLPARDTLFLFNGFANSRQWAPNNRPVLQIAYGGEDIVRPQGADLTHIFLMPHGGACGFPLRKGRWLEPGRFVTSPPSLLASPPEQRF